MSNFITFPVATTNIFPLSNSKAGGQLATEFNLRSRETIGTPSIVEYPIGPSYTHSMSDFEVSKSSSIGSLIISPGRALVNGHYVETLAPMTVDLIEENSRRKKVKEAPLKGKLAIGIRAIYSTEATMAGSMKVENEYDMYEGVQLVVLPDEDLLLPIDVPEKENRTYVKAHIKLATFNLIDGAITSVDNNPDKIKCLEAGRIMNIGGMLDNTYVRKSMLNPRKLYVFAGKGTDPKTGEDTWCPALDSLMVWDAHIAVPTTHEAINPNTGRKLEQAEFITNNDKVKLMIPHKQVDGMSNTEGKRQYYPPRILDLPAADYSTGTPGTVDRAYTQNIKDIEKRLNEIHQMVGGKQVSYMDVLTWETSLPKISPSWKYGDYVLVNQDYRVSSSSGNKPPATMYVVLPGPVQSIGFKATYSNPDPLQNEPRVRELSWYANKHPKPDSNGLVDGKVPSFFDATEEVYGMPDTDYFVLNYYEGENLSTLTKYYYSIKSVGSSRWSDAVILTGEIGLAQTDLIGGFYNIPVNDINTTDAGYVYLDDDGHLRLYDYGLLRSGTLAYQLGEDISIPKGLDIESIQTYLDEFVNERVAFPTSKFKLQSANPKIIHVYLTLPETSETSDLYIRDIDSRFGTCVYLHIEGSSRNVTIHISGCERIRIAGNLQSGGPVIDIEESCLYYDAAVMDYIRSCHDVSSGMSNLKLWYERFEESSPNLVVDGMTVSELDAPIISTNIDYWNKLSPNDNHYCYALKSITFSGTGDIVGCQMLVANDSTNNVDTGHKLILSEFKLPQGYGLMYPETCITKTIKVTGTFVSAYHTTSPESGWVVTDTNFTALTGTYDPFQTYHGIMGTISFHADTNLIPGDFGVETIPGWESDTYHIFSGGVIS